MHNRSIRLAIVAAACLATAAIAQKKKTGHVAWPYGVTDRGDGPGLDKRDLFNLGLLGAKAWDADRDEPEPRTTGGKRSVRSGPAGDDVGPRRLLVRALFGGGPAQRAGLQIDDVIVGVGQASFENGCYQPLAIALREAESRDGKLALEVERGGEKVTIHAKIDRAGKAALEPTRGKQRDAILQDALKWLADRQVGGGYPETLGGKNGSAVMTSLAGLAWLAGGSSLKRGKFKGNIDKATKFVLRELYAADPFGGVRGGANWDQSTWAFAHAAIFFGEALLASKSKTLKSKLQDIVDVLQQRQEASGGYAHGPGGKNALDYLELNIQAVYVLCGLSLAKQAGCTIEEGVVERIQKYLEESAGQDGGVGYSSGPGQRGSGNIGRTAGAWLGLTGLGRSEDEFVQKMRSYVETNIADVMGGHASLQQHILLAGVAAAALGDDARASYWDGGLARDLTLARAPDGSLQMRPWHESLSMGSNTDVSLGEVWSTASWAIVLGAGADKGGLPGWAARRTQ